MISSEDIKRLKTQKNATHKNTHKKDDSHRNTHHTRQGGRTDLSTSSQGLSPSGTDRVMRILNSWCVILWGYSGIVMDYLIKEIKAIRDTLWK